jgi:hypothetical protein
VRLVVAAAITAALPAPAAHAGVILGVHGNAPRFASQTGQQSQIGLTFVSFAQGNVLARVAAAIGPVPMIALNTGSYGAAQTATSRGIALGQNDQFLFQLSAVVARWPGTRFYVRPFPEMNAHWSGTSAYNRDGTRRDAAHSTQWTRKAFARIAVVLRGGTRDVVNASLAKLGMPGIAADLPVTTPKLRMVWNPQGFGAHDVAGNSAQAYYPVTPTSTWSAMTCTTCPDTARRGRRPRSSMTPIRRSPSRFPSSGSGASTIRSSSAAWRNG